MIRRLASLVLLVVAVVTLTGCMTPEKRARLEKLKQEWQKIPTYPDFKQVDYDEHVKDYSALISCFYDSSSYANVKDFYTKELLSRGWSLDKNEGWFTEAEGPVTFRKDNYEFVLSSYSFGNPPFLIDLEWSE